MQCAVCSVQCAVLCSAVCSVRCSGPCHVRLCTVVSVIGPFSCPTEVTQVGLGSQHSLITASQTLLVQPDLGEIHIRRIYLLLFVRVKIGRVEK